jgi:putative ABC transport system substrate-binding protein
MITRREILIGAGLGSFSAAFPSFAQQAKVARVGFLAARPRSSPSNPDPFFDAFVRGMRELGYIEGKNLVTEWRSAEGIYERLPALAAELVQLKPEVIVSHTTPGAQALLRLTRSIPIVVTSVSDPIGGGLTASLARPDKNVTGMSIITVDLSAKQLELLKIMLPTLSRISVLIDPAISFHATVLKSVRSAGQKIGMQVVSLQGGNPQEIERAFERMSRETINAAMIPSDSLYVQQRRQIAELAIRYRIATIYVDRVAVEAGVLLSYGTSTAESYRRAATYVDKILKGAKPGDLPFEQPSTFELTINRRTAKAIGISVPKELLDRADEVID